MLKRHLNFPGNTQRLAVILCNISIPNMFVILITSPLLLVLFMVVVGHSHMYLIVVICVLH